MHKQILLFFIFFFLAQQLLYFFSNNTLLGSYFFNFFMIVMRQFIHMLNTLYYITFDELFILWAHTTKRTLNFRNNSLELQIYLIYLIVYHMTMLGQLIDLIYHTTVSPTLRRWLNLSPFPSLRGQPSNYFFQLIKSILHTLFKAYLSQLVFYYLLHSLR